MSNAHDQVRQMLSEARDTLNAADSYANTFADLIKGRLRGVNIWTLQELKKELRAFNAHTGKWRASK